MMYNILWIDDDFEKLSHIRGEAKDYNLLLNGFRSLNSGFEELEKNYHNYDGILLDAKFLEADDDDSSTADTEYVHRAKEKLWSLPKKFEIFVFTGQAEAFGSAEFKKSFPNVYIKGDDDSVEKMFNDMRAAAAGQQETQIRHQFPEVFKILDDKYLGSKHSSTLLSLLKHLGDTKNSENGEELTALRKILESLFSRLSELEILPINFTNEKGWINGASKFMSNKHESYSLVETEFFHPMARETVFRLLNIVQDGSHNEGNLNYKCDEFIRLQKTGYLTKSAVYALCEVLVYFGKMMSANQNPEENRRRYRASDIEGYISEIQETGWGKFTSKDRKLTLGVPPKMMKEKELAKEDPVKVTVKPTNKTHIETIQKINI